LDLDVVIHDPDILRSFRALLPKLLKWENAIEGIRIANATLTTGNPRDPNSIFLRNFESLIIDTPPEYMYSPLTVVPKLVNPFTKGVGLDIDVYFPNPGPLHLELGDLGVKLMEGNDQIGKATLTINTINKIEGGASLRGNKIPIAVRITLNFITLIKTLEDLITGHKRLHIQWFAQTKWLTDILNNVPEDLQGQLVPILLALLRHVHLQIGPFHIGRRGPNDTSLTLDPAVPVKSIDPKPCFNDKSLKSNLILDSNSTDPVPPFSNITTNLTNSTSPNTSVRLPDMSSMEYTHMMMDNFTAAFNQRADAILNSFGKHVILANE
jgi:hypothetical protein